LIISPVAHSLSARSNSLQSQFTPIAARQSCDDNIT
jgi:hypothetical protein